MRLNPPALPASPLPGPGVRVSTALKGFWQLILGGVRVDWSTERQLTLCPVPPDLPLLYRSHCCPATSKPSSSCGDREVTVSPEHSPAVPPAPCRLRSTQNPGGIWFLQDLVAPISTGLCLYSCLPFLPSFPSPRWKITQEWVGSQV